MQKPSINSASSTNQQMIEIIRRTKVDQRFLRENNDFRQMICESITDEQDILDIGRSMRDFFQKINARSKVTIDINDFGDYPDLLGDICGEIDQQYYKRFDHIICLAILEHVYDPISAVKNLYNMTKPGGIVSAYTPYLFPYHAPKDLTFQDYYRFSRDGLSYLFREFSEVTLFPVRGRYSTGGLILFGRNWKRKFERIFGCRFNYFLDRFASEDQNIRQCSGFNIWAKK